MHHDLVKHWITSSLFLGKLLGDYTCGVVLLEAHFSDHPEVTAEYVAARLGNGYSDDTARRRMKEMAKAGVLSTRKEGRTVLYRLDPDIADAAISFMKGEPVLLPATKVA